MGKWLNKLKSALRYAFAVNNRKDVFSNEDLTLLEKIADGVVRRKMTTPALLFLESVKPLNFLGSQVLHFFYPIASLICNIKEIERLATILEKRESISIIMEMIEKKEESWKKN
jgi:hypothetical protein